MTTNPSERKLPSRQLVLGLLALVLSLGLGASVAFAGLPANSAYGPPIQGKSERQNPGGRVVKILDARPDHMNPLDCTITGSISGTEPTKNSVLGATSACGTTIPCPGELTGAFHYDTYPITNSTGSPVCATITLSDPQCIYTEVYAVPPTSSGCVGYVADNNAGSSFQVTIPGNTTYYLAVEEYFEGQGCTAYTVTVTGAGITCATGGTPTVVTTATTTRTATAVVTGTGTATVVSTGTATVPTSTTTRTVTVVPPTGTRTATVIATATRTSTVVTTSTMTRTSVPTITSTIQASATRTSTVQMSATSTTQASATRTSTVQPSATRTSTVQASATRTSTVRVSVTPSITMTPCSGRVTICHRTGNGNSHTITVSCNALPAHLAHGDTLGPCPQPTPRPRPNRFSDVNSGDYFHLFVLDLNDDGALGGYNDGTFRPFNNATRGQFVKIAVLAFHIPLYTGSEQHFSDVPTSHTFYQYIETARQNNIIGGYSDGTFRPNAPATRAQIAKVLTFSLFSNPED